MNKKIKTLLVTGALTLGLCTGCGNNKELTALQEKYDSAQKTVEQYKEDNDKLTEQNEKLKKEVRNLKQDKKISELEAKEKEEEKNEDVWYTCEKCRVTNGDVKLHNGFYMCPNCIEKEDNSTTNSNNSKSSTSSSSNYNSSFGNARDDVTTDEPSQDYVYWTPNGKSYHSSRSCPTLSRSKVIYEGYNCPKTDPCDVCN